MPERLAPGPPERRSSNPNGKCIGCSESRVSILCWCQRSRRGIRGEEGERGSGRQVGAADEGGLAGLGGAAAAAADREALASLAPWRLEGVSSPHTAPPQPAGAANDDRPWLHSWPRAVPRLTWRLNACGGGRSERGWQELDSRRRILIRCKHRGGQWPWPGSTHPLSNPSRSCWIARGMRSALATTAETPKMGRSAESGRPAGRPGPVWRTRSPEGPSLRYAAGRSAYHHPRGPGWETRNPWDGRQIGPPAPRDPGSMLHCSPVGHN